MTDLAKALQRIKYEAISLADAQVIALDALAAHDAQPHMSTEATRLADALDAPPFVPADLDAAVVLLRTLDAKDAEIVRLRILADDFESEIEK